MKISVTKEDIDSGLNPIEAAILRQFEMESTVDRKFILFEDNRYPFRLPLSAEIWNERWNLGRTVEPFSFDIAE